MVLLAVLALLGGLHRPLVMAPGAITVVVHETVTERLTVEDVRRIFLLRRRFWHDGSRIFPVNQDAATPVRSLFSRRVLGGRTRDFAAYWNDLYFHGTVPPPTAASDEAVLLYVARTDGAIGYVSTDAVATPPRGVRVVLTVGP